ncbi:MAG: von Willebrand factor type A domain-containing protein [Acidobacteria bacterium]|nr:von Willebrand factor type A domain-containing protein [Acidobacteriota bacterium]
MSWLKQRIHPLQLRYVAAACALCLVLAAGGAGYWLLTWSTEPAETGQVARLEPEPSEAAATGDSLKPPEEASQAEASGPPPVAESAPAQPEKPAPRPAKEAAQSPKAAEPAPVAATEGVAVEAPSQGPVLSMESPVATHADPRRPPVPVAPPPPPPGSAAAFGGVSASRSAMVRSQATGRPATLGRTRMRMAAEDPGMLPERGAQAGDRFASVDPNRLKVAAEEPVSTFSIDVDTASYSFTRASLQQGVLPPKEAVRIEELINYFPYDYPAPSGRDNPFATQVTVLPAPWNPSTRLMHIGIRGFELTGPRPRANLVFLIDTSGSMGQPDKLPLLVNSLRLLLGFLAPEDRVAIVTYAGASATALKPTRVSEREKILAVLGQLRAGGSTAGASGIQRAYRLARQHFIADGVNRVILATDGDFNVGITDLDQLQGYVERERKSGVYLSVLGFGMGNLNDRLMQALAQNGNGVAAYIDTLSEAQKVLVEEATSTLFPIAKDVKIQVEFNPARVSEYRLIGYESRMLAREDFQNDRVDAGEVGSGHRVTAIYEITPVGSGGERVPPLRYESQKKSGPSAGSNEYAFVKIRYKLPESDTSTLISQAVTAANEHQRIEQAPLDVRFAAAVAGFGQLLRESAYTEKFDYDEVIELAQGARGEDRFGYRSQFLQLVRLARSAARPAIAP